MIYPCKGISCSSVFEGRLRIGFKAVLKNSIYSQLLNTFWPHMFQLEKQSLGTSQFYQKVGNLLQKYLKMN